MVFRRKTPEEKAARREHSEQFKKESREMWETARKVRKRANQERDEKRLAALRALLQPDETLEATLRTAEVLMKKDVLFTTKRVIIASTADTVESIPYRSISRFHTSTSFLGKSVTLEVAGRRGSLELGFDDVADRDRAVAILNQYAI